MKNNNKKLAFTLAEIMLTLTLIGTLATLTLSTIGASIQQRARISEFRAAYAKMDAALKNVSIDNGQIYYCFLAPTADEVKDFALNIPDVMNDSLNNDCAKLEHEFVKVLGATRYCQNNPIDDGCIPENYPKAVEGCFVDYDNSHAYVLDNSMIIITNNSATGLKLFALDINGRKGPNKWGQDIFPFSVKASDAIVLHNKTFIKSLGILPPNEANCKYTQSAADKTTTQVLKESSNYH